MSLPPKPASGSPRRILLVRFGAMGDIIQTLPAVADLRRGLPGAKIVWVVDSRWRDLLAANPDIDELVCLSLRRERHLGAGLPGRVVRTLTRLRSSRFDLAFDMQGLLKSAALAAACAPRVLAGLDHYLLREPHTALLYDRCVRAGSNHVVDRYRALAALATGGPPPPEACFPLPPGELRDGLPERYVLVSPQAGWGAKEWPRDHFGTLAAKLWRAHGIPLVVDHVPDHDTHAAAIRAAAPDGAVLLHPSTIPQLVGATRRATAVLGVDSGPLHLAAALGKPGVAIFGPTDPNRNGPYGSSIAVLRAPAAATSYKRTSEPAPSMRDWSPDAVYRQLASLLPGSR